MNSTAISYNTTLIKPLSLQAAAWSYSSSPYTLRIEGCAFGKGKNCSQACVDPDLLFSNGSTFENCLAYPALSTQILQNDTINSQEQAIYVYGIKPNDTQGSRNIVNTVNSCLKGWADTISDCDGTGGSCTGDDYGDCTDLFTTSNETEIFPAANGSDPLDSSTFRCINKICSYVAANAKVSADIGGIGIYISYIIQVSLILVCWVIIEYFRFLHPFINRRLKRHSKDTARVRPNKQKEIFVESVIEFHRAQCYFMATILIAALVATNTDGLGASTFQQIFNNFVLLSILSIGGSLLIMFMLLKLRLAGHRSWYTFTLSSITLLLALVLAFLTGPHKDISVKLLDPASLNIPNCGTIDPTALCLQGFVDWQPGEGTTYGSTKSLYIHNQAETLAASIISLILWLCLLLDGLRKLDFGRFFTKTEPEDSEDKDKEEEPSKPKPKPFPLWARLLFAVLELLVTIGTIYLLVEYLKDLVSFGIGPTDWSFGQIVAITVWTPPVVQYIYLQIHGAEGSRWHLPHTLTVARKSTLRNQAQDPSGRGRTSSIDLKTFSLDGHRNRDTTTTTSKRPTPQSRATTHERLLNAFRDRSSSRARDDE